MNNPAFEIVHPERVPSKERAPQQHSVLETLLQAAREDGEILDAHSAADFEGIANESLAAIADHGSLELLDNEGKHAFLLAAFAKLKPGGMYSLFHRSDREDASGIGRSREFLEALFPKGVEHILDWNESRVMGGGADGEQSSWSTIVRKPGSSTPISMVLNSAMTLGAAKRDSERLN